MSEPVEQHELIATTSAASRWEIRARRGLTRFAGREDELARLEQSLERSEHGDGRVVAVVGEAGIGKSRLVHEFLVCPRATSWAVRIASASPLTARTAYGPIRNLLRGVVGVTQADRTDAIRRKLHAYVDEIDPDLDAAIPALESLLDLPPSDREWTALEPRERRRRTAEAVRSPRCVAPRKPRCC